MGIIKSLKEGKIGLVGGVDLNGRRAGRGEDLSCCSAYGKDVCGMGVVNGVRGKVLL